MKELTVYDTVTCERRPLEEMLVKLTDEFIDSGQSCPQITIDLRDACKELLAAHRAAVLRARSAESLARAHGVPIGAPE